MKLKKIAFGFLLLSLLACSTVTNMIVPPTATLTPSATITLTASPTATATATPLVPAYIPPECANKPLATLPAETAIAPTAGAAGQSNRSPRMNSWTSWRQVDDIVRKRMSTRISMAGIGTRSSPAIRSKIEAGLETEDFYYEMESMVEELGDEHSFFLSPLDVKAIGGGAEGGKHVCRHWRLQQSAA